MVIPVELSGCIFQAAAGSGVPWSDKLSHRVIDPVMRISHLEYMSIPGTPKYTFFLCDFLKLREIIDL